jgi:DNA-binding GntR family transcriptional regulator
VRVREEVTARMPTPNETRGLAIPDGVPVLDVLHTGIDTEGRAFAVSLVQPAEAPQSRPIIRLRRKNG